ncbi:MAG: hypothetical protein AAFU77_07270 [Myxococcota bacterium]
MRLAVNLAILVGTLLIAVAVSGRLGPEALSTYADGGFAMHVLLVLALAQVPLAARLARQNAAPVAYFAVPAALMVVAIAAAFHGWDEFQPVASSARADEQLPMLAAAVCLVETPKFFALILIGATALMFPTSTRGESVPLLGEVVAFNAFATACGLDVTHGALMAFGFGPETEMLDRLASAAFLFSIFNWLTALWLFSLAAVYVFVWRSYPGARSAVLLSGAILVSSFAEGHYRRSRVSHELESLTVVNLGLPISSVKQVGSQSTSGEVFDGSKVARAYRGADDCAPPTVIERPATVSVLELVIELSALRACDVRVRTGVRVPGPRHEGFPYLEDFLRAADARPFQRSVRFYRPKETDVAGGSDIVVRTQPGSVRLSRRGRVLAVVPDVAGAVDRSALKRALDDAAARRAGSTFFVTANPGTLQRLVDVLDALEGRSVYWMGVERLPPYLVESD